MTTATNWPVSPHEAARFILDLFPDAEPVTGAPVDAERIARADEPPVLEEPKVIEGSEFAAIHVADPRSARGHSGFAAFLDGTQEMRIVNQRHGIPVVWGTVAAAVRSRIDRRLVSWSGHRPIVRSRYYLPFRYIKQGGPDLPDVAGFVDTAVASSSGKFPSRHPAALMEAAVKKVQQDREQCELDLAEAWCATESAALYVDGSIAASPTVSRSSLAVGVVKTHRRLYADGAAFPVLVGLAAGSRSSIFLVSHSRRHSVASWYLRTRTAGGRDPLFGLLRVEAALDDDIGERANEISRWLIAEGAPLALPDSRWDKMAYGIRDTEEFLRAIS